MKRLVQSLTVALALTTALPAHAGGPVMVEDTTVDAESPRSGNLVPIVIGAIILCAIACGGSDDPAPVTPPGPICNTGC